MDQFFRARIKWITIVFALFIVMIIVLADRDQLGILKIINQIPLGDKVGHFVLYGIMTLLLDLTFLQARSNLDPKLLVLRIGLIFAVLIGLEEFSQKLFPSRTFDLLDLTFSYLGVTFFSWLSLRIKGRGGVTPPLQ